jgi:hypothetical protein
LLHSVHIGAMERAICRTTRRVSLAEGDFARGRAGLDVAARVMIYAVEPMA